jgi:hypothetical protein
MMLIPRKYQIMVEYLGPIREYPNLHYSACRGSIFALYF